MEKNPRINKFRAYVYSRGENSRLQLLLELTAVRIFTEVFPAISIEKSSKNFPLRNIGFFCDSFSPRKTYGHPVNLRKHLQYVM